jgi:ABC-2 type transport system ATP-binding protein
MSTSSAAVQVERVVKRFGAVTAVDDVSFAVPPGEIFGLIGPDGGGKTTLFRILATLLIPDSGSARALGHDVVTGLWDIRPRLGYMPGRFSLYPDLTVEENVRFYASVFGTTIEREYERIEPIYSQLEPFRDRRAGALSGGMKQKLALSCALVHRPELLLLDEPTTGVDAVSRREFWEMLGDLRQSGLTIVVSTPYMDEADRCDRVALMHHGKILVTDTPERIRQGYERPLLAVTTRDRYRALHALRRFPHLWSVFPFGESLHYTDGRKELSVGAIAIELGEFLIGEGFEAKVEPIAATIEDSFMEYVT